MAKISELLIAAPAAPLDGTEGFHAVQGAGSVGATVEQVGDYMIDERTVDMIAAFDAALGGTSWKDGAVLTRTSTSSFVLPGIGTARTFTFTANAGLAWFVGMRLKASAGPTDYLRGVITALTSTTVEITPDSVNGDPATTFSAWTIAPDTSSLVTSSATSTTSRALGTGSKSLNYPLHIATPAWGVGTRLRFTNDATHWMEGVVTAVLSRSVTILADKVVGAGTFTAWTITIAGEPGAAAFTALTDAPASYSGQGSKGVRVNSGETGLEFYDRAIGAPFYLVIAVSDETKVLTAGVAKITFRLPRAITLTAVRASLNVAATGATLLAVDINEAGVSILSTKLTFDASEKTTTTAATPAVISDPNLADDAEITIDIDAVGSTVAGAGLKVALIGITA